MSHFVPVIPLADVVRGRPVSGQEMANLDAQLTSAVDGYAGGTCAPTSAITIGGAGLVLAAATSTVDGAGATVQATTTAPITFGRGTSDDYFGLGVGHPGRSRILTAFVDAFAAVPSDFVQAFDGGCYSHVVGSRFRTPLRVYNGGLLFSVAINFRVVSHSGVPATMPKFRVVAVAADGTATPLSISPPADALGFISVAAPATGAAWYASGATQTFVITCDVVHYVDVGKYAYYVDGYDESGANSIAGTVFFSTTAECDNNFVFDGRS